MEPLKLNCSGRNPSNFPAHKSIFVVKKTLNGANGGGVEDAKRSANNRSVDASVEGATNMFDLMYEP